MPQISRVRIVNFYYNNGHRFIPDLTFSFEGKDGKAMDTLISLTNGGGKSVIVQMLLQPILPRQKLGQRRLESYFTRPTDHSFVLLEWKLDDSTQRLLTGIAISGRGEEDDNERGRRVRFYTFCASYGPHGDRDDIVNLALSTRTGREFQPAPYEFVKEQAKKRTNQLKCFREDQQSDYRKVLKGYSISADEWKSVIAEINQQEGGLSSYFDQCRNSSSLIDKVLLPCVEKKLNAGAASGEENALSKMLLDFAQDFHNVEDKVRQRNLAQSLEAELKECCDQVEPLYHKADECESTAGQMRGFTRSLEHLEEENQAREVKCSQTLLQCQEQEKRIRLERQSHEYHRALAEQERTAAAMEKARQHLQQSEANVQEKTHRVTQLECAALQGQIREQEGILRALQEQKRALEGDSDQAETLNRLRYTVWSLSFEALAEKEAQLSALEQHKSECEKKADKLQQRRNLEQQQLEDANAYKNRVQGAVETQKTALLTQAKPLGVELDFRLDGTLEEEPIRLGAEEASKTLDECVSKQEKYRESLAQLEERLEQLREQHTEEKEQLGERTREKKQAEERLNAFCEQEEALRELFRRRDLSFSQRFTDRPKLELRHRLEENRLRRQECVQRQELLRKQMEAAEKGELHVPSAAVHYLNSRGVSVQTCEDYLRKQKRERTQALLERYPICAYGILLTPEEREAIASQRGGEWIPSAVPLFTYDDLDAMLAGTYQGELRALASYSEEYFSAPEQYREGLEGQAAQLTQTEERLKDSAMELERDLRAVEDFTYGAEYERKLREKLAQLDQAIRSEETAIQKLIEEQETAKIQKKAHNEFLQRLMQEQYDLKERIRGYAGLENLAAEYAQNMDELLRATGEADKREREVKQTQSELNCCRGQLEGLSGEVRDCSAHRDEYQTLCRKTEGAPKGELVDGELETLCVQLEQLEGQQEANQKSLANQMEQCCKTIEKNQRDLGRKKLSPSDYGGISYSEQALDEAEEKKGFAERQLREAQAAYQELHGQWSEKKGAVDTLRKGIHGQPLPPEEIHYQFEQRERQVQEMRQQAHGEQEKARSIQLHIGSIWESCQDYDSCFDSVETKALPLEQDFVAQWKTLRKTYEQMERERKEMHNQLRQRLQKNQERFGEDVGFRRLFIDGLNMLKDGENALSLSNRYYSIYNQLYHNVDMAQRMIESLNTQIGMLDERRVEMDNQFYQEGQRIYEHLKKLAESTRVKVEGKKSAIPMLKINLPEQVEPQLARSRISHELSQGLDALLACLKRENHTKEDLNGQVKTLCRSRNLLNCYTGQEELEVRVYKVDYNRQNSQYRTWRETMVGNSGAEKFVSCFAVLVAMLNYSRAEEAGMGGRKESSVLLLDNPFGAITSAHLLKPMFQIAAAFRVQMICLSDISKCDVTECFDSVIKAAVKKNAFSQLELLDAEKTEQVERAFFLSQQRTEQFSLF